jgi:hypothetical protein
MANAEFINRHGRVALENGALWQVLELSIRGGFALSFWMIFKLCEQQLKDRYFAWANASEGSELAMGERGPAPRALVHPQLEDAPQRP